MLPGDRAELSVPLGRVGAGEHLVRVAIPYGPHRFARWQGRVDLPPAAGAATSRPVATARTIEGSAVPSFMDALLGVLAALVVVLAGSALGVTARRRSARQRGGESGRSLGHEAPGARSPAGRPGAAVAAGRGG